MNATPRSTKSFTMLLKMLNEAFPGIRIPNYAPEIKKSLKSFDLGCEKIAACPNDCMLFREIRKALKTMKYAGLKMNTNKRLKHLMNNSKQIRLLKRPTKIISRRSCVTFL